MHYQKPMKAQSSRQPLGETSAKEPKEELIRAIHALRRRVEAVSTANWDCLPYRGDVRA
jgi:hypothetical protein